jgi:hypothetical protein
LLEYFKFSGGNIGEKVTMFFTTFSSQNPSEKFETKFMTFSARLTPIFHASLGLKMMVKNVKPFSSPF